MKTLRKDKKLEEAKLIYLDLIDFFSSEKKIMELLTIVPAEDIFYLLDDLEKLFINYEYFEKCSRIRKWRTYVSRKISPDKIYSHLY